MSAITERELAAYLGASEAARRAEVSVDTIRRYMVIGALPFVRVGGMRMISPASLEALIAKRQSASPEAQR